ncbi:hypothetical protein SAY87_015669 [Trapa incisa]|uniref:Uncharacterized protein n=1 Tax=Trapa incisa TaxID=236973 RepID=A0AAN7L014_9MYRT|nr:hypothetical protein SAY87_015669 [Trapa incisa]
MAPKGKTRRRSKRNSRPAVTSPEKPRTTHLMKSLRYPESQQVSVPVGPASAIPSSSCTSSSDDYNAAAEIVGICSTPKGRRFRIPAINTCPPAPKKQRALLQRRHVAFFAHPDIDLFFNFPYVALIRMMEAISE